MFSSWTSPSGGLVWHMRALHRRRHWNHFLLPVGDWLDTWHPASTGLLLIGPSAGWCIPDSFLGRFSQIHALDIDPLAGKIFRVLHRKIIAGRRVQLTWQEGDLFEQLEDLLCKYPDHAVLFCNVLGQHGLHQRVAELVTRDFESLSSLLRGRVWASFHDRLSGGRNEADPIPGQFLLSKGLDTQTLVQRVAREGQWIDHLTQGVFPENTARLMIPWGIRPGVLHWVEAGFIG